MFSVGLRREETSLGLRAAYTWSSVLESESGSGSELRETKKVQMRIYYSRTQYVMWSLGSVTRSVIGAIVVEAWVEASEATGSY